MTLEDIKNEFESITLKHKQIKTFDFGEKYDASNASNGNYQYPLAFLEIPYLINYELPINKFKTLQFALNILIKPEPDKVSDDHQAISDCEVIGEAIITRIMLEVSDFKFDSVSGLSLREFSDDNCSGFRFDFQIRIAKNYCNKESYDLDFNS